MRIIEMVASVGLGLSLCSPVFSAEDAAKPPEAKNIGLSVRVVDRSGKPIAGATVQAWKNLEAKPLAHPIRGERMTINDRQDILTGEDGWTRFSLSLAPQAATGSTIASCIYVTAQAKDFMVVRSDLLAPGKNQHFEVVMTMQRLASIRGRVIDGQGHPVAGATVFHTGNAQLRVEAITDAEGLFKLDGLPAGKAPVFVTHPGFRFHGQLIDTMAAPAKLQLLGTDETPSPRKVLPPSLSHKEELQIARQIIQPLWDLNSQNESEKEQWHARIDPWHSYNETKKQGKKDSQENFFYRNMPLLYAADPEESLAELESLKIPVESKAFVLVKTARVTPDLSRKQKQELLDRAMQHVKTIANPAERIEQSCRLALALYDAGNVEGAKKIADEYAPQIVPNLPKAYGAAVAGEIIALFDLPAGVKLAQLAQGRDDRADFYRLRSLFHIAYRCAKTKPAEAEKIVTEALQSASAKAERNGLADYHRDLTEEELSISIDYCEARLIPVCYWMAAADPDRAERIAASIHNPYLRAYAIGMVAQSLASEDKPRAKRDILRSFEFLTEAAANPKRYWLDCQSSAPIMAGALLPTVEEIDPTLVNECMWQAISFRLHRSADDLIIASYPEHSDACLAAFIARYDRELALAIFPAKDVSITPSQEEEYCQRFDCLSLIDARQALQELNADLSAHRGDRSRIMELLTTEWPRRWNNFASDFYIWTPDYEVFQTSFPW